MPAKRTPTFRLCLPATKQTLGEAVKGILTTPVLIGILLGLFFGVSGLRNALASTSVGPVIDEVKEETDKEFYSSATSVYTLLSIVGFMVLAEILVL